LYSSPDIIRQIKSRRMRWGRACGTHGRREKVYRVLVGKARRKKTLLEDQGVDGRMGSEWILGR
jgi:hypothetical protein